MKLLNDFLPIILFFVAYKFGGGTYEFNGQSYEVAGIYAATAVMMVVTLMQVSYSWLRYRKVEKVHLVTLVLVTVLGAATLWLQNPDFIMWKPTAVNWLFAAGFIGAQLFTDKTLLERLMGQHVQMPAAIWNRLNIAWILFFIGSGILNLYVAYGFSEETWVNFKLFGMLGLTLVFIVAQSLYLAKHATELPKSGGSN
ncbi:Intracellular septation protein IspA [Methylophaga frappieri]|uniref:Inner membrane-spanning protein YciB n=1 Tax=Methylophaga frappieri (strain ATCC BAA-2434 / DSM 25690 / JAM7) TaxID=754477 RepID=I1YKG2_METFJ|nr:septation protein A [Methylophaga frappieri]AFJ03405.1 Intracellular septation protein IspA [Methylophaga frappieri]